MFCRIAESITQKLEKNNAIQSENREIYRYGLEQGFIIILNIVTIIIIGIVLKALPQSLLFMLFYSPMRSYAGANVKIYRESDNSKVTEFNIPITQSGMPTLYYYATLSPGQYYVKIRSDNLSTYSTGGFTVSYISGTYNH